MQVLGNLEVEQNISYALILIRSGFLLSLSLSLDLYLERSMRTVNEAMTNSCSAQLYKY